MSERISKVVHLFHAALSDSTRFDSLTDILSPDVVLHQDGLSLDHDVKGAETVKQYYKAYVDKFSAHKVVAVGYSWQQNIGFALWVDEGATLQQEAQARAKSGGAPQHLLVPHTNSQTAVGIAAYKLPPGGSLEITDIYQMRQLTADEAASLLKEPTTAAPPLDISKFKASGDHAPAEAVLKAAQTYSSIWQSGDVDAVDPYVADDFEEFEVITSGKPASLQDVKHMVASTVKEWDYTDNFGAEALAEGDESRCFIFWEASGKITSEQGAPKQSLFGLNFLLYDKQGKITKIASFRQPLPSERKKIFK